MDTTADGGYILGGTSLSGESADKSDTLRGDTDYWIVKVDSTGAKEWDKTFGGSDRDEFSSLEQTSDGGYILGGASLSESSGEKSEDSRGEFDYWVIKLDAQGNIEWEKTFGGESSDWLRDIIQTSDGGYLLGGTSSSGVSGEKSEPSRGENDFWVIKLDADGNKEWDHTYGGDKSDLLAQLQQTNDGGFILGGSSESGISGEKSEPSRGSQDDFGMGYDYWIVKIDEEGNKEWDRTFGGLLADYLSDVIQTEDGGYLLGGSSGSSIGADKSEEFRGGEFGDYWIVKTDSNGNKEWDRTYGGTDSDELSSIQQTSDGGYVLGGVSESDASGEKSEDSKGSTDFWIVKTDAEGNIEWDKTIGGSSGEGLSKIIEVNPGDYIIAGTSSSGVSGDKSEPNRGVAIDYWIVKLNVEEPCTSPTPSISVVPTSDVYTGGDPATLYLGYGPQSVQLVASGAERYEWSPAEGLSDATVANPIFTPMAAGSYTFTVTAYNGECAATASVTITVVDVRCGNGKVILCHKGKMLCIPASAVAAHLRNHSEDRLGACGACAVNDKPVAMRVYPNPLIDWARVELSLSAGKPYRLELYSAGGKLLKVIAEGTGKSDELTLLELRAEQLRNGVYYLRLITADEVQTRRLLIEH
ncbi:T9SS type A sorting domain-containing protein [Pontibacter kalidii]|uniref:T9SS type A sorting domain-containing protein n=1 Tax=Pontibacter kalidii TaxID=2592049 RepID=UPI00225AF9A2|nr:T9SS type A sorting domain-containing protein [Pontibacter kalidii]